MEPAENPTKEEEVHEDAPEEHMSQNHENLNPYVLIEDNTSKILLTRLTTSK